MLGKILFVVVLPISGSYQSMVYRSLITIKKTKVMPCFDSGTGNDY